MELFYLSGVALWLVKAKARTPATVTHKGWPEAMTRTKGTGWAPPDLKWVYKSP